MKINIFDVVELENNDKATIKEKLGNNKFKAEIVNENGITKEIREIESIHNLIKNNGQNFNLSKEQLELAEKLK